MIQSWEQFNMGYSKIHIAVILFFFLQQYQPISSMFIVILS